MLQTIIARLFYNVMRQLEYNRRGVVTAKKLDAFVLVCARVAFIKTFHRQSVRRNRCKASNHATSSAWQKYGRDCSRGFDRNYRYGKGLIEEYARCTPSTR